MLRRLFSTGLACRNSSYKSTVDKLNSLQSNAAIISALRASGAINKNAIPEMRDWLAKAKVQQKDIDELKIIHVAGTKGKGSTCAMVASILSHYRLAYGKIPRIGLYTSPHLKSVRERIQIDGQPLPEEEWTEYFNHIWNTLSDSGSQKPVYFRFLTILAFHTFIEECVDVVILECGVGGEHDSTNVITRPVASGITSLGIDHIHVLGDTIESIAWHKAGIFKTGSPAYTVSQPNAALEILRTRAKEREVSHFEVLPLHPALDQIKLGLQGDFQKSNATLAITLANEYLKTQGVDENLSVALPAEFKLGLEQVRWAGRCEQITIGGRDWCLDGGHTSESLRLTGEWYSSLTPETESHALIFNQQSRDAASLLKDLHESLGNIKFERVIFCTNKTFKDVGYSSELMSINNSDLAVDSLEVQKSLQKTWQDLRGQEAMVVSTIEEAVEHTKGSDRILVTGSLHLVGGTMTVLDTL